MQSDQGSAGFVRSLQILYFALTGGQIAVFVLLWTSVEPSTQPGIYQSPVDLLFIALWMIKQTLAFFLPRKLLAEARSKTSFDEKLSTFRRSRVLRFSLMEGSVLVSLVGFYFVTANYILLGLASAGIVLFIPLMPTRNKMVSELELTAREETMLDAA